MVVALIVGGKRLIESCDHAVWVLDQSAHDECLSCWFLLAQSGAEAHHGDLNILRADRRLNRGVQLLKLMVVAHDSLVRTSSPFACPPFEDACEPVRTTTRSFVARVTP